MLKQYEKYALKGERREYYTNYFYLMKHRSHKDTFSYNWLADTIVTCNGYSLTGSRPNKMFILSSNDTVYFTHFDSTPVSKLLYNFEKEFLNLLKTWDLSTIRDSYVPTPECVIRQGTFFYFSRMIIKDGNIIHYDTATIHDGRFTRRFWDKYELEFGVKGTTL